MKRVQTFSLILFTVFMLSAMMGCKDGNNGVDGITGPEGVRGSNAVGCGAGYVFAADNVCRDRGGYDVNGYGANGYNVAGYNVAGYDANGYDPDGCTTGYSLAGDSVCRDSSGDDYSGKDVNNCPTNYDLANDNDCRDSGGYDVDGYDDLGQNATGGCVSGYTLAGGDKVCRDSSGFNVNGVYGCVSPEVYIPFHGRSKDKTSVFRWGGGCAIGFYYNDNLRRDHTAYQ